MCLGTCKFLQKADSFTVDILFALFDICTVPDGGEKFSYFCPDEKYNVVEDFDTASNHGPSFDDYEPKDNTVCAYPSQHYGQCVKNKHHDKHGSRQIVFA